MSSDSSLGRIHDAFGTLGPAGTPFSLSEIREVVDCDDQTLREQLAELVADGLLETKEIGASDQIWWRPAENRVTLDTAERTAEHFTTGDVIDIFPDLADVMMIAIDQTGEITLANAKASEILGYTQDELVGTNWFERCVPDRMQADVEGVFSQLVDGDIEPAERYENPVVTADGEERIIEWHNTILRDDGDIVGTLSSGLDITERKRAEEAVRNNEQRLEALIEATTESAYRISPDWSEIFQLDADGFLADDSSYTWEDYIPDAEQARVGKRINEAIETQSPFEMEHKIKRADGTVGWAHSGAVPIIEDGDIVEWFGTATDITERKEREVELKRREAYLESVSDLVTVVDEEGIIQYETPAVTELLGYDPDERIGDLGFEYIHPDDRDRIRERFEEIIAGDSVDESYEYRAKTNEGEWIWVETTIRNCTDDPTVDGIIVTARDITDRKEQQREKELLWEAVEKADSALVLAEPGDENNPMVYVNEAFEEMTGYAKSEAIGRDCRFLQGEDTRAEPVNELREGIENGESVTVELRNYRKDGTEFWNRLTIDPVYDANGDLVRYLGTQEDITERKEQERKRNQVIDRVTDAIFEVNADGQFTYVSDRAETILDRSEADLLGRELFTVFEEAQGTEFEERYRTVLEKREPVSFVAYYSDKDSWYDVQLYPNDDGGVSAYFRDVSDRKERERARRRAEKQYQTLLELAPLPVIAVDIESDSIIEANEAAGELLGYQADELVGKTRDIVYPDQYSEAYEDGFQQAIKDDGTIRKLPDGSSLRLATKDGKEIPVEARITTVTLGGRRMVYGIFRDITDEKQYQQRLAALNEITQELSETETKRETKQTAADILAEILDVATVAFYRFDDTDWELRPVVRAGGADAGDAAETLPVIEPGNGVEWTALKNGATAVVDDFETRTTAADFERAMRSEIAVPVGEQYVLVVGATEPDTFDTWTVSLVETLGAATAAALTRTQQQQELQQQNQELRAIESLNQQIREIAQTVVEADTRADLERLVCGKLTDASQIDFAWFGRVDHQANRLSPQTQAGTEQGYLDNVSLTLADDDDSEPSVRAARSKAVCDCANTTGQHLTTDWRSEAVERGFRSILSIPLVHEGSLYGVVSMYATTDDGFSPPLRSVLEELGELLADAAVSKERKEALHADQTVKLSFDIWDQTCLFEKLVAGTDCSLQLDGFVPQSGDTTLVYVRVTDGTAGQLVQRAEQIRCIETSRLITENDDPLVLLQVSGSFIGTALANSAYVLVGLQVTAEETTITIEVPSAADTRQAISLIESQFENAQLRSKQQVHTSSETDAPFPGNILETLTSRQREVVETAYRAGYFDSPRRASGADIAEMFGFSDTAFHKHIREAQSKLFAELLSTGGEPLPSGGSTDTA